MKQGFRSFAPATVWTVLALATCLTFAVGEWMAPHPALMVGVLLLSLLKGGLVALDFMELRHASTLWRYLVLGWLLLVVGCIIFVYLNGSP
jgi:hypothetical protein